MKLVYWSVSLLSESQKALLAHLPLLWSDFKRRDVQAIFSSAPGAAFDGRDALMDEDLDALLELGLIMPTLSERASDSESTFQIRPLVRLYLTSSQQIPPLSPDDVRALELRRADWLHERIIPLRPLMIEEQGLTVISQMRRFVNDYSAPLEDALAQAILSGNERRTADIASVLGYYFYHSGRAYDGRRILERAVSLPEAMPGDLARAWAWDWLASLYTQLNDPISAARALDAAERTAHEASRQDRFLLGGVYAQRGNLANEAGDYRLARSHHERSLDYRRGLPDVGAVANSLTNLSAALSALAKASANQAERATLFAEAEAQLHEAAALYEQGRRGYARRSLTLSLLGDLFVDLGDTERAEAYFMEARDIARGAMREDHGSLHDFGKAIHGLGCVACACGDANKAARFFRAALKLARRAQDRRVMAYNLSYLTFLSGGKELQGYASIENALTSIAGLGLAEPQWWAMQAAVTLFSRSQEYYLAAEIAGASFALKERHPALAPPLSPFTRLYEESCAALQAKMGETYQEAFEQGRSRTWDEMVERTLQWCRAKKSPRVFAGEGQRRLT